MTNSKPSATRLNPKSWNYEYYLDQPLGIVSTFWYEKCQGYFQIYFYLCRPCSQAFIENI